MVRKYVLTDHEKQIIEYYLDKKLKLNGYRQLQYVLRDIDLSRVREDLELIKRFLEEG